MATLTTVTGTLTKVDGTPLENVIVRAMPIDVPQQVQQGSTFYTLGLETIEVVTTSTGSFSIDLLAGSKIRLTIGAVGFDLSVVVPDTGPVDFIGLQTIS